MAITLHDVTKFGNRNVVTCAISDAGLVFDGANNPVSGELDPGAAWSILVTRDQFPHMAARLGDAFDITAAANGSHDEALLAAIAAHHGAIVTAADALVFDVIHKMLMGLGLTWRRTIYSLTPPTGWRHLPTTKIRSSADLPKVGDTIWIPPDGGDFFDHYGGQTTIHAIKLGGPSESRVWVVPKGDTAAQFRYDALMEMQEYLKKACNHPLRPRFPD